MSKLRKKTLSTNKPVVADVDSSFEVKPIDTRDIGLGINNPIISIIAHFEAYILNTFIYSYKLINDLPRLLVYINPMERVKIACTSTIYSAAYAVLHYLKIKGHFRWLPFPYFTKTTVVTLVITNILFLLFALYNYNKFKETTEVIEDDAEDNVGEDYEPKLIITDEDAEDTWSTGWSSTEASVQSTTSKPKLTTKKASKSQPVKEEIVFEIPIEDSDRINSIPSTEPIPVDTGDNGVFNDILEQFENNIIQGGRQAKEPSAEADSLNVLGLLESMESTTDDTDNTLLEIELDEPQNSKKDIKQDILKNYE